jgi:hypothetical protein
MKETRRLYGVMDQRLAEHPFLRARFRSLTLRSWVGLGDTSAIKSI